MAAATVTRTPRLRRADCTGPGIARRRHGRGFRFLDADGEPVDDDEVLRRIHELVIPPAWEDVWICPYPGGHIQATGVDAAGRKQYLYHPRWRERRDMEKFEDMVVFARTLPKLRKRVDAELADGDELTLRPRLRVRRAPARPRLLPRRRRGLRRAQRELRPGDDEEEPREHARRRARLRLPGQVAASAACRRSIDPVVADVVRDLKRRRGGGDELLAYKRGRRWVDLRSEDINAWLKEATGKDVSAKDFRTWAATVLAAVALAVSEEAAATKTGRKRAITRAIKEVAHYLGNTPAVARASYIDPRVFDRYRDGEADRLPARRGRGRAQRRRDGDPGPPREGRAEAARG